MGNIFDSNEEVLSKAVLETKDAEDQNSVLYKKDVIDSAQALQAGKGGGQKNKIKKMIVLVVPLQSDKNWTDRHDGKDYDEMHIIVADNIYIAKEKFYKYLKDMGEDKAENVILDTHGGGPGLIYLDNIDGSFVIGKNFYGIDELKNLNDKDYRTKSNLLSLKMIKEKVKDDGNVIFLGCTMAKGKEGVEFMVEVHKFNYRTNTFVSEAYNYATLLKEWSDDSYYTYYDDFRECINWGESILLSTGDVHKNEKGKGYKLMTAFKSVYKDLADTGDYDGNLLINGKIGAIKY